MIYIPKSQKTGDNIFTIVHKDKVKEIPEALNKLHRNLRFTMKIKDNGEFIRGKRESLVTFIEFLEIQNE